MEVIHYIQQLLLQHKYVILPEFGGFIAKPKSADIHPTKHYFLPPSKELAFNKRLTEDDGLLINYIASEENLSYSTAHERVSDFIQGLQQDLEQQQLVVLPQIGKLYYDKEQNLQFSPQRTVNYSLHTYGLPEFQFYPIQRKQKQSFHKSTKHRKRSKTKSTSTDHKSKDAKRIWPWALTGVGAVLVSLLLLSQWYGDFTWKNKINQHYHNVTSFIYPVVDSTKPTDTTQHLANQSKKTKKRENSQSTPGDTSLAEQKTSEEAVSAKDDSKIEQERPTEDQYYIVIGSFSQPDNAQALKEKLQSEEMSVTILKSDNGYHRVGIGQYDKDEALNRLSQFRETYHKEAWVLKEEGHQS